MTGLDDAAREELRRLAEAMSDRDDVDGVYAAWDRWVHIEPERFVALLDEADEMRALNRQLGNDVERLASTVERLRGVVARVEGLADEGFWFVRFYGDTCGTCHSVTSAHQINPAGVLSGDESAGGTRGPNRPLRGSEGAREGAEGTHRREGAVYDLLCRGCGEARSCTR